METSYLWEATAEGHTRMTLRNRGTPAGFSSLAAPFMTASMRRANKKDLARLKALLEARKLRQVSWAVTGGELCTIRATTNGP